MREARNNHPTEPETRADLFNQELALLCKKYNMQIAASVSITPDGRIAARPVVIEVGGKKEDEDITKA